METNQFRVVRRDGKYYAQRKHVVRRFWLFGEKQERWKSCLYNLWLEAESDFNTEEGAWHGVDRVYGGERLKPDGVMSERAL